MNLSPSVFLQAEDMIHDIRKVFLANMEKLDWMDDVTKEKAREKVGR